MILEYKINEHITLKLERNKTIIYGNDERFWTCIYLLLNIPLNESQDLDEIESIDQTVIMMNHDEYIPCISPIEEFWGHYSNL